MFKTGKINYNSILFNDNVMVVFVGNINNQKNLELLIKTINKKSNAFNIAFLNGCMMDKNIYDILDENDIERLEDIYGRA